MAKIKNILILTQPLHSNYGGLLQAYALQTFLRINGYNAVTENRCSQNHGQYLYWYIYHIFRNAIKYKNKKYPLTYKAKSIIEQNIKPFVDKYINTTQPITSNTKEGLLKQYNFDAFIVGSDQVWRPRYSPYIYNYFLDFTHSLKGVKRIAYAASFGVDNWEFTKQETRKCKSLIQHFDAVSVREESAITLCNQYFDIEAQWVMDPVFLLSKQHYLELLKDKDLTSQNHVFTHFLDPTQEKNDIVQHVKNVLKLNTFSIMPAKNYYDVGMRGIENCIFKYTIEDFLHAIYTAEYIVTDSFHVVAFSIIFNKQFCVIPNITRGVSRFQSILSIFGLEDRIVIDTVNFDQIQGKIIDYDSVNRIMKVKVQESTTFLLNALQ